MKVTSPKISTIRRKWEEAVLTPEAELQAEIDRAERERERDRQKQSTIARMEGLIKEVQAGNDSPGYIFGRLRMILSGTKQLGLADGVLRCRSKETTMNFVYQLYLAVAGLSMGEKRRKIKIKGQLGFEKERNLRMKH